MRFVVVLVLLGACGARARVMSGVFASCAKADLGQVVAANGATLLADVAQIIEGNAPTLEQDLTALAAQVGFDAVVCAISAAQAVLAPKIGTAAASLSNGLVRAIAWSTNR